MPNAAFRKLPMPKVFFPFLAYDWRMDVPTVYSFLDMMHDAHLIFTTHAFFQDGVARQRNVAAHHFLEKSDAEFIFWIGMDVRFTGEDIERILAHMVLRNLDICGGLYSGKGPLCKWIVNKFDAKDRPDPNSGLLKAKHVGSEFLCVRRRAYETIRQARPEIAYKWAGVPGQAEETHWNFHAMPIHDEHLESEDWNLCRVAHECGINSYVDTKTLVHHRGNIFFPLFATLTDQEICDIVARRYRLDLGKIIQEAQAVKAAPQMPALT